MPRAAMFCRSCSIHPLPVFLKDRRFTGNLLPANTIASNIFLKPQVEVHRLRRSACLAGKLSAKPYVFLTRVITLSFGTELIHERILLH